MTRPAPRPMTTVRRTLFRGMTTATTGLATFGALLGSGWVAGVWARDYQHQKADEARTQVRAQEARSRWFLAHPVVKVVEKKRTHRTIERTVRVVARTVAANPGPGSPVRRATSAPSTTVRTSHAGAPSRPAQPAPAPPPPPPAPSSGS